MLKMPLNVLRGFSTFSLSLTLYTPETFSLRGFITFRLDFNPLHTHLTFVCSSEGCLHIQLKSTQEI